MNKGFVLSVLFLAIGLFIGHWLVAPLLFPEITTRTAGFHIGLISAGLCLVFYGLCFAFYKLGSQFSGR